MVRELDCHWPNLGLSMYNFLNIVVLEITAFIDFRGEINGNGGRQAYLLIISEKEQKVLFTLFKGEP